MPNYGRLQSFLPGSKPTVCRIEPSGQGDMRIRMRPLPFWFVFAVAWFAYAATYLLRKPLGVIKSAYSAQLQLTNTQLGCLDMAMLLAYSLFQTLLGMWADRLGPRRTFSLCLFGGGLALIPFIIDSRYASLVTMLFVSGAFQSFCWAACNSGLTKWFDGQDKRRRHTVLGYFGTSPFAGGVFGTIMAVETLKRFPLTHVYALPACINIVIAFAVFVAFQYPEGAQAKPGIVAGGGLGQLEGGKQVEENGSRNFLSVAKSPGTVACGLSVACLKIVRYGMYFWLPLYFERALGRSTTESSYMSIVFDVGAATGSLLVGIILRIFFSNNSLAGSAWLSAVSACSIGVFVTCSQYIKGALLIPMCLLSVGLAGASNGIPDVLLCGSIPIELAPKGASSAFIGFINGLGSVGGTIEGPLIGLIADKYGWQGALILMVFFSVMASICTVCAAWQIRNASNRQRIDKEDI